MILGELISPGIDFSLYLPFKNPEFGGKPLLRISQVLCFQEGRLNYPFLKVPNFWSKLGVTTLINLGLNSSRAIRPGVSANVKQ